MFLFFVYLLEKKGQLATEQLMTLSNAYIGNRFSNKIHTDNVLLFPDLIAEKYEYLYRLA